MTRLIVIPLLVFLGSPNKVEAEKGQWPRLITVNGDGEILVTPDEATIELGVETIDPDVEASLGKNSDAVRRVIQSITELGVDLPNIQTERLSINPVHRDQSRREDFLGYECRCTIFVRLTDLSKFETLVATALKNDAHRAPHQSEDIRVTRTARTGDDSSLEKCQGEGGKNGRRTGTVHRETALHHRRIFRSGVAVWSIGAIGV